MEIKFYDRYSDSLQIEKVCGGKILKWLYQTNSGEYVNMLLCRKICSKIYGLFQETSRSKKKIEPFVTDFKINMDEFIPEEGRAVEDPYSNFNQFFIRRFKKDARKFVEDKDVMPAFSEARYLGFRKVGVEKKVPVKGLLLSPEEIIGHELWHKTFMDGPMLVARLCPIDYHRFHFPDNGKILDSYRINGLLHSVNPLALKQIPDILFSNEREVTILDTENFGRVALIEVGALCVGKIVQTFNGKQFNRADEKGFFLFGGSTVIVIGEKNKWVPSQDILKNSEDGMETFIKLGDAVARAVI